MPRVASLVVVILVVIGYFKSGAACATCSVTAHCGSHATSVTPNTDNTGCACTCRNKWSGTTCSVCAAPYGGPDCERCLTSILVYPGCAAATAGPATPAPVTAKPSDSACVVKQGTCVSKCTGGTFLSGLCPASTIMCCVRPATPAPRV